MVVLLFEVIGIPQVADGMQDGVMFPLLRLRSIEGRVLSMALVEDAPVGTPFLDTGSLERGRSDFPPAAGTYGNFFLSGVDIPQFVALLAGSDHA
jgi:hypothetical protein